MPAPPPQPAGPPRYHISRSTALTLTPGTLAVRLAAVTEAEWQWLEQVLIKRGWKVY